MLTSYSKYENIWNLLSSHMVEFEETLSENFYCLLCKKVMVEPHAGLCGCQYCGSCIREYSKDRKKYCPGIKNECKEDYLELSKNVSIDFKTVFKLGKLIAKCPNELCNEKCVLETMNDHMRICDKKTVACPYSNIGCESRYIRSVNVNDHFDSSQLNHSKLLVEAIDNLRNDVKEMKKLIEEKEKEVLKLKMDLEKKDSVLNDMKIEIGYILKGVQSSNSFLDQEFICKIDTFSKLKESKRWMGNIFWRYSYKFYLLLWFTGDNLRFKCVIMKGEFDKYLKWPMKHMITLSIRNQETMKTYLSKKYDYDTFKNKAAFEKPCKDWNDIGIGDETFISVKEIKTTTGLLINDSIVVSCMIDHV